MHTFHGSFKQVTRNSIRMKRKKCIQPELSFNMIMNSICSVQTLTKETDKMKRKNGVEEEAHAACYIHTYKYFIFRIELKKLFVIFPLEISIVSQCVLHFFSLSLSVCFFFCISCHLLVFLLVQQFSLPTVR